MKEFILVLFAALSLNTFASQIVEHNGEVYCKSHDEPNLLFKYDYDFIRYGKPGLKSMKVLKIDTGESEVYQYIGRQHGLSFNIFKSDNNNLNLGKYLYSAVWRNDGQTGFIKSFDEIGNPLIIKKINLDYSITATYRPWEDCDNKRMNPEE